MDFEENVTAEEKEIHRIETDEDAESISLERYAFNSFRIERSIRDILTWVKKGKIIIPEFQRDFVWNFNQSSRFIESILLGLPIPDFFMFRLIDSDERSEKYILIDGLQRYTAIQQFVNEKYMQGENCRQFKINDKSSQWYNKTYSKLLTVDQDFFQDYSLKINVFDSVVNSENTQKLYMTTIFERINTGSTKLSSQEVRNAIYVGETVKNIKNSVKNDQFLKLLQCDKKKYDQRCKNEEFYLRLLSYYHVFNQLNKGSMFYVDSDNESKLSSSKDMVLCNFLYYSNNNKIDFNSYNNKLKITLDKIVDFDPMAFCTVKLNIDEISTHIHEVFSEALVIAIMSGSEFNVSVEMFRNSKIKIWRDKENYQEFFFATTDLDNITKRVTTICKVLNGEV